MRSTPVSPDRSPLSRHLLPPALATVAFALLLALLLPAPAGAGRFALGLHLGSPYALHGSVHLHAHGYGPGWGYGHRHHPVPVYPLSAYPLSAYPVVVPAHHPRAGGFDLNVRPKKAEVWVDGRFVGLAREFDGWPSYLWLRAGDHTVSFRYDGYRTETLEVRVAAGAVHDLRVRLREGVSTPPPDAAVGDGSRRPTEPPPPRTSGVEPAPTPPPVRSGASTARGSGDAPSTRDARREPGQLRLRVRPEDAAVYLDGRLLGSAAELSRLHAGLLVDPGDHLLEVVHPDHHAERLEVLVEEGEVVEVDLEMGAGGGD